MKVTLNGNTLSFHNIGTHELHDFIYQNNIKQFSCIEVGYRLVDISTPANESLRLEFAGLIHRNNNENKLGKKLDTGKGKPDNDPTPPGRGGGAKVTEFVNTQAIAA